MNLKTARVVGFIGKTFITTGLLLLGLVIYQLWGTGIETRHTQSALRHEFNRVIAATEAAAPGPPTSGSSTSLPPVTDALALLEIPSASISGIVVEGVTPKDLRRGPGHFPKTPMPGEMGNSAIAAHRTSYAAPFGNLDKVKINDIINVTTTKGKFEYTVVAISVVSPSKTSILANTPSIPTLTLITCHPRFSTSKRLVVRAELSSTSLFTSSTSTTTATTIPQAAPDPPPAITPVVTANDFGGWFSDSGAIFPSIFCGALLVALATVRKFLYQRIASRVPSRITATATTYAVLAIPFLVTLFYFYRYINLLLPAGA